MVGVVCVEGFNVVSVGPENFPLIVVTGVRDITPFMCCEP